jgi:predicted MFS family arabinose efflux permease
VTGEAIPWATVGALGLTQILAWGTTYYLLAVLAEPIAADTGWPMTAIVSGLSLGLLVAGLISPRMGQIVERYGGRPVLATSSVVLAVGLGGLAASPNLTAYLISWAVLGIGMGTGLYDAAFATLGRAYGADARRAITAVTLLAGFSSTICWPLSSLLIQHYGWRATCLVYAALHLGICLAVHLCCVPGLSPAPADATVVEQPVQSTRREKGERDLYVLAIILTLTAMISAVMSVQLVAFILAAGVELTTAVALAAMLGPSQVGVRLIEMAFGRHYHPIWTLISAAGLMAVGIGLLAIGVPLIAPAVITYGGGVGIAWIARGTVPLALLGPTDYAVRMGRLALPSLIAQALSPSLGTLLLATSGPRATLLALFALALLALAAALWLRRAMLE